MTFTACGTEAAPLPGKGKADYRLEPRVACGGPVRLRFPEGGRPLNGELIEISAHGFRLSLDQPALAAGLEVEFLHPHFRGRAKVMWTKVVEGRFEAGCMVVHS